MVPSIHSDFINHSIEILKNDLRILGIAIGGSYISDEMDEFSDIDLVIAVDPNHYESVMDERFKIVESLGRVLSAFTGEHVGEPRLVICLYGPPLLHVDFKFVSVKDIVIRVEDPIVLWERDNAITNSLILGKAEFPTPNLQWIEDRFWVWIHYGATKIGRNEIFEAIDFISFIRQTVIGPLVLMKNGKLPRGVRKIEYDAPYDLPLLLKTIPTYDAQSCIETLQAIIKFYLGLREYHATPELIKHTEAEKYSKEYLVEILKKVKRK
ncbi:MAG: oxalate:formate antiporter [Clostridium lundense]|nr:oxalate:formate antiporter [Clostridium lundense]